jgi:hypothetical protein
VLRRLNYAFATVQLLLLRLHFFFRGSSSSSLACTLQSFSSRGKTYSTLPPPRLSFSLKPLLGKLSQSYRVIGFGSRPGPGPPACGGGRGVQVGLIGSGQVRGAWSRTRPGRVRGTSPRGQEADSIRHFLPLCVRAPPRSSEVGLNVPPQLSARRGGSSGRSWLHARPSPHLRAWDVSRRLPAQPGSRTWAKACLHLQVKELCLLSNGDGGRVTWSQKNGLSAKSDRRGTFAVARRRWSGGLQGA